MKKLIVGALAMVASFLLSGGNIHMAAAAETAAPASSGADWFMGMMIYAADPERSIKFYSDILGLKTAGRVERDGKFVEILLSKSGKLFHDAVITIQPTRGLPERMDPNRTKFGLVMFMTSDNKALAARLRAAGYEVTERDPQHMTTKDPDGYELLIYQYDEKLKAANQ